VKTCWNAQDDWGWLIPQYVELLLSWWDWHSTAPGDWATTISDDRISLLRINTLRAR
jgi:hypothetical protein